MTEKAAEACSSNGPSKPFFDVENPMKAR
jgi:hypothetical protein